jgi:tRNA threonylcarbamoyladenosine biosynthesis protein TsaE
LGAGRREETRTVAKAYSARGATVVALQGDLGAGKTTFVQGFFKGLGLKKRAQSPTFIIMRRHALPAVKGFKSVFHVDAYRLKNAEQMRALDFHKILHDPQNVILIEWPERMKRVLPAKTTWISFEHGEKENERKIIIKK